MRFSRCSASSGSLCRGGDPAAFAEPTLSSFAGSVTGQKAERESRCGQLSALYNSTGSYPSRLKSESSSGQLSIRFISSGSRNVRTYCPYASQRCEGWSLGAGSHGSNDSTSTSTGREPTNRILSGVASFSTHPSVRASVQSDRVSSAAASHCEGVHSHG